MPAGTLARSPLLGGLLAAGRSPAKDSRAPIGRPTWSVRPGDASSDRIGGQAMALPELAIDAPLGDDRVHSRAAVRPTPATIAAATVTLVIEGCVSDGVPSAPWANDWSLFDQTIEAVGDYTVDASTNLGAPFVNVLNTLCNGAASTTCSFTQQGPLTWGTGDPDDPWVATHCGAGSSNFAVSYTAAQTATLSVGGSLTLATQVTLFDVEPNSIAVSVEASHQWSETKSETRMSSMDIPAGEIGYLWVIPTVGKVVGTLVVSNGSATFTANNFTQVRSGVSRDALTPAFDVVTKVRAMTSAELQNHCGGSIGSTLLVT